MIFDSLNIFTNSISKIIYSESPIYTILTSVSLVKYEHLKRSYSIIDIFLEPEAIQVPPLAEEPHPTPETVKTPTTTATRGRKPSAKNATPVFILFTWIN